MKSNLEIIQYLEEFVVELEENKSRYKEVLDDDPFCEHTTDMLEGTENDLFTLNRVLNFAKSA